MRCLGLFAERMLTRAVDGLTQLRYVLHLRLCPEHALQHALRSHAAAVETVLQDRSSVQPAYIMLFDYCLACGVGRIGGHDTECPVCGEALVEHMDPAFMEGSS